MEFDFDLQPTVTKLEKETTLHSPLHNRLRIPVRDQTDYQLTIDLAQSSLRFLNDKARLSSGLKNPCLIWQP